MSFADLGLLPPLADSLTAVGLVEPTPVQRIAIPALLGGVSAIVVARTGSGKTLAYALPLLQRLHAIEAEEGKVTQRGRPRAIVLTATRELVDQTMKAIKGHAHALKARVRAASGGLAERAQRLQLADPVDVVVANPPRLVALLKEGLIRLDDVRLIVVDEADTLLAPGQRGDIDRILLGLPPEHALALISATLPEAIRAWAMVRPERPVLLLSKDAHSAPESVSIQNIKVRPIERLDTVHDTLVAMAPSARGILFCNRRETADLVGATLRDRGHSIIVIHGALEPNERKAALKAFRAGEGRVLITTELGGRGLHLDDLAFVLNYELPEKASEYLHRIGRVGRQGAKGKVVNLVTEADAAIFKEVERLKAGGRLDTGERLRSARDRATSPDRVEHAANKRAAASAAGPKRGKGRTPDRAAVAAPKRAGADHGKGGGQDRGKGGGQDRGKGGAGAKGGAGGKGSGGKGGRHLG